MIQIKTFLTLLCLAGVCGTPIHPFNSVVAKVDINLCTDCKEIVGTIYLFMSNNATETEILAVMNEACTILPTSIRLYVSVFLSSFLLYSENINYRNYRFFLCNDKFCCKLLQGIDLPIRRFQVRAQTSLLLLLLLFLYLLLVKVT